MDNVAETGTVTPDVAPVSSSPEVEIAVAREASQRTVENGDPVEIWDVRRGYLAKWVLPGSSIEGGVTGKLNVVYLYPD